MFWETKKVDESRWVSMIDRYATRAAAWSNRVRCVRVEICMLLMRSPSIWLALDTVASTWSANVSLLSKMTPRSRTRTQRSSRWPSSTYSVTWGDDRKVKVTDLHLAGLSLRSQVFYHELSRSRSAWRARESSGWAMRWKILTSSAYESVDVSMQFGRSAT